MSGLMLEKATDTAEKLIESLKGESGSLFLNAEMWKVVFAAYQEQGRLSEDARLIIYRFAETLMLYQVSQPDFNSNLEGEYLLEATNRLGKYILIPDKKEVNVTYFHSHIKTFAYKEVLRKYESNLHVKLKRVEPNPTNPEDDPLDRQSDTEFGVIHKVICEEQERAVVAEIEKLPNRQRETILARVRDGKRTIDIAKERGVKHNAVSEAYRAGKENLDRRLHEKDDSKPDIDTMLEGITEWPV